MPEELLQLEGRLVDEAMVGLDGTTERRETSGIRGLRRGYWGGETGRKDEDKRGEMGLERGSGAEDGQTGRTERDWSMDDGRRDNVLDSDQLAQTFFVK